MKYIKPKIQIIELKEDIACVCGSNCRCTGRDGCFWDWWNYGCTCKSIFTKNSIEDETEESEIPQTKNLWDEQW